MSSDAKKKPGKGPSFADITSVGNVPDEQSDKLSKSPSPTTSSRKEFRTDKDISKNRSRTDRVLEKWNSESSLATDVDLNKETSQRGGKTSWDQFAENERLFGVKTDFDEAHYTTPVGREKMRPEEFKRREVEAERLAKEILTKSGTPMTVHVAEERGLLLPDDMDEEERYGSVVRRVSIVSTEDHDLTPRKSSIASLGEKAQPASSPPHLRRKSIVEQVSEEMNYAMKGILEDRQRRKSSLNPDAPEFSLNVNAPEYTPQTDSKSQQQYNPPYAQYPMFDYSDPQAMSAMMNSYYAYDPYAMNAYYAAAYQQQTTIPTGSTADASMSYQQEGVYNPNAYYRPYRQPYVRNGGHHRESYHNISGSHDNVTDPAPATNPPQ